MDHPYPHAFGSPASSQGPIAPNNSPRAGYPPTTRVQPNALRTALEVVVEVTGQSMISGVTRPRQATSRSRRGSATPNLQQSRSLSTALREFDIKYLRDGSHNPRVDNVSNYPNTYRQQLRNFNQQTSSHHQVTHCMQNDRRTNLVVADDYASLQQRLHTIVQIISSQTSVPSRVVSALTAEIHNLSQLCINLRAVTKNDTQGIQRERERLQQGLAAQQRLIQNALAERDRACIERDRACTERDRACTERGRARTERDRLQTQVEESRARHLELEQKIEEVEKKQSAAIEFLRKQIRFKDEQITGKRSLWLSNHRDSGARRLSDAQDPFSSPSGPHVPRMVMALPQSEIGTEGQLTPPCKKPGRWPMIPPTGSAETVSGPPSRSAYGYWPYHETTGPPTGPWPEYECGVNPIEESSSTALVRYKTEEEIGQEFREEFDTTYGLILAWVQTHISNINELSLDQELSHDKNIWPFMLSCTYVNIAEAHEHVILLIRNPRTRALFVMRMIVQYLCHNIWKANAFERVIPNLAHKLQYIEERLQTKGLTPDERATLVGMQTQMMRVIVQHESYLNFRAVALSGHSRALRAMLDPIIDVGASLPSASRDLCAIVVSAWDLAAKLYTSNFTFLIKFPTCGSKFLSPSMVCIDPRVEESALQLHIRQARLKLIVTPIITMRNDRNMTITAKTVQDANVLIFP